MTRRYVVGWQPSGEWTEDKAYGSTTMEVVETLREPTWTGLLDARGNRLMAVDERPPVGFLRSIA
jgi:hypothetical protein